MHVNTYGSYLRGRTSTCEMTSASNEVTFMDDSVSEGEITDTTQSNVRNVTTDLLSLDLTESKEYMQPRESEEIQENEEHKVVRKHPISHTHDTSVHYTHHRERENGRVHKQHHDHHNGHRNRAHDTRPVCRSFPNCRFGNSCKYRHPRRACKYHVNCKNVNCQFNHAPPRHLLVPIRQVTSDVHDITAGLQSVGLNGGYKVENGDPFEDFLFKLLRDNQTHPHAVFSGVAIVTYIKAVDDRDQRSASQARLEHEITIQCTANRVVIRATHDNVSFRVLAASLGGEIWGFFDANDGGKPYKRIWCFKSEHRRPKLVPREGNRTNSTNGLLLDDSRCEYC
ncbi:hypothetical protein SARC_09498 [Sphaeroforma arctica JP610]|uniref:C3H1-type domain-containing protein n=1 Tax=Sphaeroforma arctica JP610 TaxID=667725 RepID=A0A0L0FMS3_9EUKA|nr:hypothetical protein SARC_09498 [Sphaeroforma arctica JP610]KNC78052.1 hypothetical protein SARC_09498 [Sphaeroforma arctica JP610]|eukprot:XP_014151954.1 hypothetical protein SARC_09498 [Sphaeroforma arctica JP610]